MSNTNVFQIFYDSKTRAALDPAFIPLDNTANERPDWFEFWVIRNWLANHRLSKNCFYGFLSPSFRDKTGINGADLLGFLNQVPQEVDAVLFSHSWDQIAYFKNAFEQGDYFHPGLLDASERFFRGQSELANIRRLVGNSNNTVFSNYFVAKPCFWSAWLSIANELWDVCEQQSGDLTDLLNSSGRYRSGKGGEDAALKVFLQERVACVLLGDKKFNTVNLDLSSMSPVNTRLFSEDIRTRKLLMACDTMKLEFGFGSDQEFNRAYWRCRYAIGFNDIHNRSELLWTGD